MFHISYYILHISYTNSEISISLSYIRPYFVSWLQLHLCATLVRDLPTSMLVLAAVILLTFHKSIILTSLWFYVFQAKQISDPSIYISTIHAVLLTCLAWQKLPNNIKIISSSFKKRNVKVLKIKLTLLYIEEVIYWPFR